MKLTEGGTGPNGLLVRRNKDEKDIEFLGEYNGDKKEFEGKVHFNNKQNTVEYYGDYKCGEKNGKGVLKLSNDDLYVGSFIGGKMSGEGAYYFADSGSIAMGDIFKEGEIKGEGTYYWVGGKKFEGDIYNGLPHGFGMEPVLVTFVDRSLLVQEWECL